MNYAGQSTEDKELTCSSCGSKDAFEEECPGGVEIHCDHSICICCDACRDNCAKDI